MKKIVLCLMATCLSLTLLPLASNAQKNEQPSALTTQKSAEREEVKTMRQELNRPAVQNQSKIKSTKKNKSQGVGVGTSYNRQGGVYLSVGGAILIVLLIIILL